MEREIVIDAFRDDVSKIERRYRLLNTIAFIAYFLIGSYACLNWAGV
jgi:hypothetical protein